MSQGPELVEGLLAPISSARPRGSELVGMTMTAGEQAAIVSGFHDRLTYSRLKIMGAIPGIGHAFDWGNICQKGNKYRETPRQREAIQGQDRLPHPCDPRPSALKKPFRLKLGFTDERTGMRSGTLECFVSAIPAVFFPVQCLAIRHASEWANICR